MSRKFSRSDALEDISNWSTNDVLNLLRKNGLEDCCHAVAKRQIDGDELLHLTEGKLSLWKSDLTRPLIWSFWTFVEEVRKAPEKYVDERPADPRANEDHLSDTGSWGTEFDDEAAEEQEYPAEPRRIESPPFAQRQRESRRAEAQNRQREVRQEEEETYANFEAIQDEENTYANFEDAPTIAPKNTSRLHSQLEKSLAEQLKEQLKLRNAMKPVVGPKPDSGMLKKTKTDREQPQKSFLHTAPKPKPRPPVETQKRMSVPPPPEPKKPKEQFSNLERHEKELPKPPPVTIRNLDLVANLPMKTAESEDEYESFDEHIIEQNQKKIMSRVSSRQSLASMHHSSAESIYKPSSVTSHEEDEPYEIYESITEAPEDSGYYLSPIQRTGAKAPPPLPAKPPQASSSAPAAKPPLKRPEKPRERSPDKKSATLPHSGSNSSLSTERATRPLPPPPDRLSYIDKPWFHNVTREQAIALINDENVYGDPQDGYFLLRPSTKNINNPLTLVLWYRDRVYNIAVRKKPDNRYALGSAKVDELSFSSVEEIVNFHMRKEIVLYTNGAETGSTRLTDTPPK